MDMQPSFGFEEAISTGDAPLIEMGFVAASVADTVDAVTFTANRLVFRTPRHFFTGLHFWRLLLTFNNVDDPNYEIVGGLVDVLVVDLMEPDVDDQVHLTLLDLECPEAASVFADLLADDRQINDLARLAGAETKPARATVVLNVFVDECLRGHQFGAALLRGVHQQLGGSTTLVSGHLPVELSSLASYWQKHLGAASTPDGLLVLPSRYADTDSKPPPPNNVLAQDFIKVGAAKLRERYAAQDGTLFPISDGRENDDEDEDDIESVALASAAQAAEAVAIAVDTVTSQSDPHVDCEIVAVLTFFTCTGEDGSPPSELFARAADYLDAHPELSVLSTNWNSTPCDSDHGEHLTMEVAVRRDD
jgi:hypothetical protein